MNIFKKSFKKKLCAMFLIVTILITTISREELIAEANNFGNSPFAALQTQVLDIQVKNSELNGKYVYEDVVLPDYKDGILLTLEEESNTLAEEEFVGDVFENNKNQYGNQYNIKVEQCQLNKTLVMENDIQIIANSISSDEEGIILYSKRGDIKLNSKEIDLNGIIYAPESCVSLIGENIQINGAIIAKNIVVQAKEFGMNGYSDEDLKKFEWIRIGSLNNNTISIDEENKTVFFQLGENEETEIYGRKNDESEFTLLISTTDSTYNISLDELSELTDFRTSVQKYGETYLSSIITIKKDGDKLEQYVNDTDGDGIPDGYEIWDLGTDPYNKDTDGDGFDDGYEVLVLCTDPLEFTEDIDRDGDGISDKNEMMLGTNPYLADSDFDGYLDSEDPEPLITDVDSGLLVNYKVEIPLGVFDTHERYYDENGTEIEIIGNSMNGRVNYMRKGNEETFYVHDALGNVTAEIKKKGDEYIANTYSYDEDGNKTSLTHNGMRYDYQYDENGNVLSSYIGDMKMEENTYKGDLLTGIEYGNGDNEKYEYDDNDNLLKSYKNNELVYEWEYNDKKSPVKYIDYISGKAYTYEYDENGYLEKYICSDGFIIEYKQTENGLETIYSNEGETLSKSIEFEDDNANDSQEKMELVYGEDKFVVSVDDDTLNSYFEVDGSMLAQSEVVISDGLIEHEQSGNDIIEYVYDEENNIKEIVKNGIVETSYEYDAFNQVIRENSTEKGSTTLFEYDNAGNILEIKESELDFETPTEEIIVENKSKYEYDNENWNDLLTSYNGNDIIYDEIGNPIKYYNGLTFNWEGKRLINIQSDALDVSYAYNLDGFRTSKVVNGEQIEYIWEDNVLVAEKSKDSTIWFMYDMNQMPIGFQRNGESYYFDKNVQGDVCAIIDKDGAQLVEYQYDAWGDIITITGDEELGRINPIRYRGYYQDNETGFYYLQSRYYDSETKRFLNTDNQLDFGTEHAWGNLFSYVGNNGVMKVDYSGESATMLVYIGYMLITIVIVAVTLSTFQYYWNINSDRIALAIDSALARIAKAFTFTQSMTRTLAKEIGASFARVTTKPVYKTTREVHHVCAKAASNMDEARKSLGKAGYTVESAINKISIKTGLHRRLHTITYYTLANGIICKSEADGKNYAQKSANVTQALYILRGVITSLDYAAPY